MWNARLDDSQAGIKISGRNINNLRYVDDTIKMETDELLYQREMASQTYGSQEETYGSQGGKEEGSEKWAGYFKTQILNRAITVL